MIDGLLVKAAGINSNNPNMSFYEIIKIIWIPDCSYYKWIVAYYEPENPTVALIVYLLLFEPLEEGKEVGRVP